MIHCMNAGDWAESMTAFVENEQGEWNIVLYTNADYKSEEDITSRNTLYSEVV